MMYIAQFECKGFRSLADTCFEPAEGLNIIRGENAQGKTSLLEAILFAATSKSHRTTSETDLVRHGHDYFHLAAQAQRRDNKVMVEANWWQGAKRFKINGVSQTRVSDILGKINVVLFSPEDMVLIKGTAAHRRRFMDMELAQIHPLYLNALQQYRQVLRQRNELLRHDKPDTDQLDAWDAQLAQYGNVLIQERDVFVKQLAKRAAETYGQITDGEELSVLYAPDVRGGDSLETVLTKSRPSDLHRRMTTRGPHRDDIEVTVAGRSARNFASQGQQKTAALALKIAELDLIEKRSGEYPVLMLDEVLAELDEKRARLLFNTLDPRVQCLLTTARWDDGNTWFDAKCAVFKMKRGRLEKE